MKKNILDDNILENFRKENKLQPFRIKQIIQEIYTNAHIKFEDMTTLSKDLRTQLDNEFDIIPLEVDQILDSDTTTKFSFKTRQGDLIESVLMYHYHEKDDKTKKLNRITICLSTQVGCAVGCSFCVTGKLGFKKNLKSEEMIGQILFANNFIKNKFGKKEDHTLNKVRNVVFMGMGEPLLNFDELKKTLEIMQIQNKLSLSKRHITISTAGIIPGIQRLIDENIDVMLAISLHAPTQILRERLMPIAKTYKLDDLIQTLDLYTKKTGNRIFYEYIMIDNINDSLENAKQLAQLLRHQDCHINLIPYNENPVLELKESPRKKIEIFKNELERLGMTVTIRDSFGREIKGACGQLGYEKIHKC